MTTLTTTLVKKIELLVDCIIFRTVGDEKNNKLHREIEFSFTESSPNLQKFRLRRTIGNFPVFIRNGNFPAFIRKYIFSNILESQISRNHVGGNAEQKYLYHRPYGRISYHWRCDQPTPFILLVNYL